MIPSHLARSRQRLPYADRGFAIAALLWLVSTSVAAQPSELRLSRYTTAAASPEAAQLDPLESVVQLNLPRANVQTVGDAIAYLLLRTGYRLAAPETADAQTRAVLSMALPEVHRRLGPYSARTALTVLLGRPYVLSVDPMRRTVSYRLDGPADASSSAAVAGGL